MVGTYTGEPSAFSSKGHCYYSNPKNWEEKHKKTMDYIAQNMSNIISSGSSSWCSIWKFPNKEEYKIDYWEDEMPLDQQLERMLAYYDIIA